MLNTESGFPLHSVPQSHPFLSAQVRIELVPVWVCGELLSAGSAGRLSSRFCGGRQVGPEEGAHAWRCAVW